MFFEFPDVVKGDSFLGIKFTYKKAGVPIDITDALIEMHCRKHPADKDPVLVLSTATGEIEFVDPILGSYRVKSFIVNLPVRKYYYSHKVTFSSGQVVTWIDGTWNILRPATH